MTKTSPPAVNADASALPAVLVESLGKARAQFARIGWLIAGFGVIVAASSFKVHDATHGPILVCGIAAFALGLGLVAFGRRPPASHPTLARLAAQPEQVVWFYTVALRPGNPLSAKDLVLGFADGQLLSLSVPPRRETEALAQVAALCPEARRGHSEEAAQAFARDPRSLLGAARV